MDLLVALTMRYLDDLIHEVRRQRSSQRVDVFILALNLPRLHMVYNSLSHFVIQSADLLVILHHLYFLI